jgi:putative hydroxymethylpyrimidine transport system permease protein
MKQYLYPILTASGLIFIWQATVVVLALPDYILPPPMQVFFVMQQQRMLLLHHALPTLAETLTGFLLGALAGCIAGCLIAFSKTMSRWFLPLLIISQVMPVFAIAPLLVIWFGYGTTSKIIAAMMMIFFPVASALYDGLKRTDPAWIELAKTMHASKFNIFWRIQLPAALPSLASGLRIAAVSAPVGAIVGEWVGSSKGLGYLMLNANARMQIDMMFAALIVIIIMSLVLYWCIDQALKKIIWWH